MAVTKKHNDFNEFTITLAGAVGFLVYILYPGVILDLINQALIPVGGGIDVVKYYQQTVVLSEKYKALVLLLLYLFYTLFILSRKQKKSKSLSPEQRRLNTVFLGIFVLYSLGAFYVVPIEYLSLLSGNVIAITVHIAIVMVFPLANKIVSQLKNHSLSTERNINFDFDSKNGSKPNNLVFSLYSKKGWVNFINVFQGFFGSGGAGSGKSASLVEPFLWQMGEKNLPGLVFDFKNWELTTQVINFYKYHEKVIKNKQEKWDKTIWADMPGFIKKLNPRPSQVVNEKINIKIVDFMKPDCSHRINFLRPNVIDSLIKVDSVIKKFMTALSPGDAEKKDIWFNGSVALFKGALLYFKNNFPQYCTLPHIVTFLTLAKSDEIRDLFNTDDDVKMASDVYLTAGDKTASSIASSLSSSLGQLIDPRIFWVLSGDDVNFSLNEKEEPTLLCLVTDEEFAQSLTPLISVIANTSLNAMNKKGRYPSVAAFDEFPQIYIDNIDSLPATCRSNKVSIMCIIQDMSQLLKAYNDKATKALVANLLNKIYFRAADKDTQDAMSNLMGEVEKIKESQSRGDSSDSSSFQVNKEKYLFPEDVLNFKDGEAVGVKSAGDKERRFHVGFRTLFKLYDENGKYIKETGYPGVPEMFDVLPKEGKKPIPFNAWVTEDVINENYRRIKEEIKFMVEKEIERLENEEEEDKTEGNTEEKTIKDNVDKKKPVTNETVEESEEEFNRIMRENQEAAMMLADLGPDEMVGVVGEQENHETSGETNE